MINKDELFYSAVKEIVESELGQTSVEEDILRFLIEASERAIEEKLALRTLILVSILSRGTWKTDFLEYYYGDYRDESIAIKNPDECLKELEEVEDHDYLVTQLVLFIYESLNEKVAHLENT